MDAPSSVDRSVALPAVNANMLAFALARNECGEKLPVREVLKSLGIETSVPGLKELMKSEPFRLRLSSYVREIKESGESFRLKSRVIAEELLSTHFTIVQDKDTPAHVRMDGIKAVVEWADLKPKKEGPSMPPPAAITINIDLGDGRKEIIDVTPQVPQLEAPA